MTKPKTTFAEVRTTHVHDSSEEYATLAVAGREILDEDDLDRTALDIVADAINEQHEAAVAAREANLVAALRKLSRQVEQHHQHHSRFYLDHACGQCVPGGEAVRDDFLCGRHEALAALKGTGPDLVAELRAQLAAARAEGPWMVLFDSLVRRDAITLDALAALAGQVGITLMASEELWTNAWQQRSIKDEVLNQGAHASRLRRREGREGLAEDW